MREEEHEVVELFRVLKRRELLEFQHPGGQSDLEFTPALVSLIPKVPAAASQSALVTNACLPLTELQNPLVTNEFTSCPHEN